MYCIDFNAGEMYNKMEDNLYPFRLVQIGGYEMRTKFAYLIALLLTISLMLSACAQQATTQAPAAQATEAPAATEATGKEVTAVIGFGLANWEFER